MALHPLALQFDAIADAYERGRPEYPREVIERLSQELEIQAGVPVLDLAAGTGKLTRGLVDFGLDVTAVEPQASLRALLASAVGGERVLEGFAESIPMGDRSVAAVTVADAFHWFDHQPALAEIARVLRPGGGLAVVISSIDWGGASWAHEVGSVITQMRPEHPQFDGPSWQESVTQAGGWSEPREVQVSFAQPTDAERVINHIESMSWVAGMPAGERGELLGRLEAIVRAGETPSQLPVHVRIGLTRPTV
jgi:SAM-dependent methyltransferase